MIEIMIYGSGDCEGNKKNQQAAQSTCSFVGFRFEGSLQQMELFGAADGSPAVVHPQLGVNVLGVGPHGV